MNGILFGGSDFIGKHLIHLLKNECVKSGDKALDLDIVMPGEEDVVSGVVEKNEGLEYVRLYVNPFRLISNRLLMTCFLILLLCIVLLVP